MGILSDPRFQKRLKLYLFGFIIGIGMVIFFFRDRFPSDASPDKVRASLKEDSLVIAKAVQKRLDSLGVGRRTFRDSLLKGEFILPTQGDRNSKVFHIRTNGMPRMKARLKVLGKERTAVEKLKVLP